MRSADLEALYCNGISIYVYCRYKDAIRNVTEREKEVQEELAVIKAKFTRSEDEVVKFSQAKDSLERLMSALKTKLNDEVDRRMRAEHEIKHLQVRPKTMKLRAGAFTCLTVIMPLG